MASFMSDSGIIRGCDVFLIQPTCAPVNDHLMELLIMVDAADGPQRQITAVVPTAAMPAPTAKPRDRNQS